MYYIITDHYSITNISITIQYYITDHYIVTSNMLTIAQIHITSYYYEIWKNQWLSQWMKINQYWFYGTLFPNTILKIPKSTFSPSFHLEVWSSPLTYLYSSYTSCLGRQISMSSSRCDFIQVYARLCSTRLACLEYGVGVLKKCTVNST